MSLLSLISLEIERTCERDGSTYRFLDKKDKSKFYPVQSLGFDSRLLRIFLHISHKTTKHKLLISHSFQQELYIEDSLHLPFRMIYDLVRGRQEERN